MFRSLLGAVVVGLLLAEALAAQDGIQRGRLKAVDADKGTVTITADSRDQVFTVGELARLMDANGRPIRDRLKDPRLKPGTAVMFKAERRDGQMVLAGLKLAGEGEPAPGQRPPPVGFDTSGLKPLPALGGGEYHGFPGGLYPVGKNERPPAHEAAGLALARQVQPLGADGKPDAGGKVVLLSVGMSNTTQEFSTFVRLADADPRKNPRLVLVDGAQGGMAAAQIVNPDAGTGLRYWSEVDRRLKSASVTRNQVQAAWVKQADIAPSLPFPRHAQILQEELAKIVRLLHERFPNLKLVYLSSRIYAGYARTRLNPEPFAYESGFAVKWLIEQQIKGEPALNFDPAKGPVRGPWLSWGPYLWANGLRPNADGLTYTEDDLGPDGTHPSPSGRQKVAKELLQFFTMDATAKPWFVKSE